MNDKEFVGDMQLIDEDFIAKKLNGLSGMLLHRITSGKSMSSCPNSQHLVQKQSSLIMGR